METIAARARGITTSFGDVIALDGVDLDIPAGQVHGLVGPNGAGKTTLLGLLLGLSVPDGGTLEVLGTPVERVLGVPDGASGFVDGPRFYPTARPVKGQAVVPRRLQSPSHAPGLDTDSASAPSYSTGVFPAGRVGEPDSRRSSR
ncbi:ATP-binding cassette domain-containing protein [Luteipulveratus halotolerans]|uniref:ATP-binding cassette domain-containing protein n=1 Tax=Luteipulveratus halotolerans TaxID=1631356 RepID=UPI0009E2BD30|nr:ATP-binding cassette domain-containing protein [Luteipulveratus halotolerans]